MPTFLEIHTRDDATRLARIIRDRLNDGHTHELPTGETLKVAGHGFIRTLPNSRQIRYDLDKFSALLWRHRDDWNKPKDKGTLQP